MMTLQIEKNVKNGFTLVEIIVVVIILAIAAVIAVPMISSGADMQVRAAANMISADMEYAKSMAITHQKNYSVVFDTANNSYQVHDPDGIIAHPMKSSSTFEVDFGSDSRLNQVDISSADFDSASTITFDYLGSPLSGVTPLNSGQVVLQAGNFTMTITVEPITGYITMQ